MSPRWSDLAIDHTIAALKNTADEQDLNEALLDLRDARARITELEGALAEAEEALEEAARIAGEYREGDADAVPDRIEAEILAASLPPSMATEEK